ncbi:WD repeat-containing protein 43-like protein [Tanacetum coccineum]
MGSGGTEGVGQWTYCGGKAGGGQDLGGGEWVVGYHGARELRKLAEEESVAVSGGCGLLHPGALLLSRIKNYSIVRILDSDWGAVAACALPWIKSLLLQHASIIMSQKASLIALNSLYQIRRRMAAHELKYPDEQMISLGIGDITKPIPEVNTSAMATVVNVVCSKLVLGRVMSRFIKYPSCGLILNSKGI